jgi:citronellol/citronellal dehydrogenase
MEMLAGGQSEAAGMSRKPDIMADAAYVILTKESGSFTGNFAIDDEVLAAVGVKDFDSYAVDPSKWLVKFGMS